MLCIKKFIIKKYAGSKKTQRRVNAALLLAHFVQDHCRKDFRRVHFKFNMTLPGAILMARFYNACPAAWRTPLLFSFEENFTKKIWKPKKGRFFQRRRLRREGWVVLFLFSFSRLFTTSWLLRPKKIINDFTTSLSFTTLRQPLSLMSKTTDFRSCLRRRTFVHWDGDGVLFFVFCFLVFCSLLVFWFLFCFLLFVLFFVLFFGCFGKSLAIRLGNSFFYSDLWARLLCDASHRNA